MAGLEVITFEIDKFTSFMRQEKMKIQIYDNSV
jgi:hypothetical protein